MIRIKNNKGFGIIELMIGVTVSLIMIAGLSNVFISSKNAFRVQQSLSVMQENSRAALALLSSDIQMADHWGGASSSSIINNSPSITGIGSCNTAWAISTTGIMGYEGGTSAGLPSGCLADADYVDNSDILVMRFADADGMISNSGLSGDSKIYVKSIIGKAGDIDTGIELATSYGSSDVDGEFNYPFKMVAYFIRPCSRKSGVTCGPSDNNIPTLTRIILDGDKLVEQALVEGVEQLQFEYGILDSSKNVTSFKKASDLSSSEWSNVGVVRIGIIARADARDTVFVDDKQYDLPGAYQYTPSTADSKFHRKNFIKTVNIRNRIRG